MLGRLGRVVTGQDQSWVGLGCMNWTHVRDCYTDSTAAGGGLSIYKFCDVGE